MGWNTSRNEEPNIADNQRGTKNFEDKGWCLKILLSLQETLCGCRPEVLGNLRNECFYIL